MGDGSGRALRWHHYLGHFFGGACLGNSLPHLVQGVSGSPFQTPFATPPGEGLSSATVNVVWGLANLAAAYLLLIAPGRVDLRRPAQALATAAGLAATALLAARVFGRLHGGLI